MSTDTSDRETLTVTDRSAPRTILVAYDFSPMAEAAIEWARGMRRSPEDPILLVHVLHADPGVLAGESGTSDYPSEEQVESMRGLLRAVAFRHELKPEVEVVVADLIGETVVTLAQERGVQMIVMGTHGRGIVARTVLGSVADYVVRHAECPVVTLRSGGRLHARASDAKSRESGLPGGGKGRTDALSSHGVHPYSVQPHPEGIDPTLRTPASLTPDAPYDESGRSTAAGPLPST